MINIPLFFSIYLPVIFKFSLGIFYILHAVDLMKKHLFNTINFRLLVSILAILQMLGGLLLCLSIHLYLSLVILIISSLTILLISGMNYKNRMIKLSRVNLTLVLLVMIKYHYQEIL